MCNWSWLDRIVDSCRLTLWIALAASHKPWQTDSHQLARNRMLACLRARGVVVVVVRCFLGLYFFLLFLKKMYASCFWLSIVFIPFLSVLSVCICFYFQLVLHAVDSEIWMGNMSMTPVSFVGGGIRWTVGANASQKKWVQMQVRKSKRNAFCSQKGGNGKHVTRR